MKTLIQREQLNVFLFHAGICALVLAVINLLYYCFPVAYIYMICEDSWAEYSTFMFYLIATFLIAGAIKNDRSLKRPGYMILCLGLFVIAMEEISWGQRLLGLGTPDFIDRHNLQSEVNIHNLSMFPKEFILYQLILIWAVVVPIIFRQSKWVQDIVRKIGVPFVGAPQLPYFLLGLFLLNFNHLISEKEFGEMVLGLAFVIFAIDIFCKTLEKKRSKTAMKRKLSYVVTLTVLIGTAVLVVVKPHPRDFRWLLNAYAMEKYPKRGLDAQAHKVFQYISAHKEMRKSESLLQYGLFLKRINSPEAKSVLLEALREQKEIMRLRPKSGEPHRTAGKIHKLLNQDNLAEIEFHTALAKYENWFLKTDNNQKSVMALKSMGETYFEMGDHQLALEYLHKALNYPQKASIKFRINELIDVIENQ